VPRGIRNTPNEREEMRPEIKYTMKARPQGWDDVNPFDFEDNPDKMHVPKELIPEGFDLRWVTDVVLGQPFAAHRSGAEKAGWTPVHPSDFNGQFDGMFTPKGQDGEIRMEGTCLMARPMELSMQAKKRDRRSALEQVAIKEQAVTGGDLNTTLDSQHESALRSNRIKKSFERIHIPDE
jgi:hypothetical protein